MTTNDLWSLSTNDLREVCSSMDLMNNDLNRGEMIKMLIDRFSLDKLNIPIAKQQNSTLGNYQTDITKIQKVGCKTCGK